MGPSAESFPLLESETMITVATTIIIGIICFLVGVVVGFTFESAGAPIPGESLRDAYRAEQNTRIDRFGD